MPSRSLPHSSHDLRVAPDTPIAQNISPHLPVALLTLGLLVGALFFANPGADAAERSRNPFPDIYEASCPSIVNIQGDKVDDSKNTRTYKGMGTGIIIDPRGFIMTNNHVVADIRKIQVTTHDKTLHTATLIARDLETDLAVIKINPEKPLPALRIGRSDRLRPCDDVLAIGNPYGYAYSATRGTVSGIGCDVEVDDTLLYRNAIQIDAMINPGNSGGPLMNVDGEMIGINAAMRQGAQGIAFAIPADQVIEVAAKLIGEYTQKLGYHGIEVTEEASDETPQRCRVIVTRVESGSPAEIAGLQSGDRLLTVTGRPIERELDFHCAMIGRKVKDNLEMTFQRPGNDQTQESPSMEEFSANMTMATPKYSVAKNDAGHSRTSLSPSRAASAPKVARQAADPIWDSLGIQVAAVPKDEYQRRFEIYMPLYPRGGVTVKSIKPDGVCSRKGVKVGDVLVGVQDWAVTSPGNLLYLVNHWSELSTDGNVRIWVLREEEHFYQDITVDFQ